MEDEKEKIEEIFNKWKGGGLTARRAIDDLNDEEVPLFSNAIVDGYFVDPISLLPFFSLEDRKTAILIGSRTIFSPKSIRDLVKKTEITNENGDSKNLSSTLPGTPLLDEFIATYSGRLKNPITTINITDEELEKIFYDILRSTPLTSVDEHNLGIFGGDLDDTRTVSLRSDSQRRAAGGDGNMQGGSKKTKKRKTKRKKKSKKISKRIVRKKKKTKKRARTKRR